MGKRCNNSIKIIEKLTKITDLDLNLHDNYEINDIFIEYLSK